MTSAGASTGTAEILDLEDLLVDASVVVAANEDEPLDAIVASWLPSMLALPPPEHAA